MRSVARKRPCWRCELCQAAVLCLAKPPLINTSEFCWGYLALVRPFECLPGIMQEGKPLPKEKIVADSDSDEETPDEEFEIPAHKVKLMIGAGGEKIKFIQRKTKCRIQAIQLARISAGSIRLAHGID